MQKDSIVGDAGDNGKEPTGTNESLSDVVTSGSVGKQARVPGKFLQNNPVGIKIFTCVNIKFDLKQNYFFFYSMITIRVDSALCETQYFEECK